MPHKFIAALQAIVGPAHLLSGAEETQPYVTDWRGRYRGAARCVVRPANTKEVAQIVALCAAEGVPIVPQGGNTSLCGASVPDESGSAIVLNLRRLNRVRDIDTQNNTMTVEAGCLLVEVQAAAQQADRFFPISLAAEGSCTIGGNIATNAGGVQVLRYGNTREQVLGLEVVLPDGRVWDGLRGLRKDNTGYDLKHAFIGAEGTLGVITAAVLKLYPLPKLHAVAWAAVRDPAAAVALLQLVRESAGDSVTAFELVSRICLDFVIKHIPGARDPLPNAAPWYVLVELSAATHDAPLSAALESALARAFDLGLVSDAAIADSESQRQALWALRENISEAQRLEGSNVKHDVSLPISHLAEFVDAGLERLTATFPGARLVAFGHVGDGNLHYNVSAPANADATAFMANAPQINTLVHDLVHQFHGSISAEHGIGQLKRDELPRYKSALELDLMRSLKRAWDPHNLMNPGKVI